MVRLLLCLVLAGCQAAAPGFLERSEQDCRAGDRDACAMLNTLNTPVMDKTGPSRPTQVQLDVQAILRGMAQARATARVGTPENVPSSAAPTHAYPLP
jgi:hypothetical protein